MTKMTKAISWCDIINLIFKFKINYSYEYIMALWNLFLGALKWIQNSITLDLRFNDNLFIYFQINIINRFSIYVLMMNVQKNFEPTTFLATFQGFIH